jgi:hypothetical protein
MARRRRRKAPHLGTLLRTRDAVGACLALPGTPHYREALARGETLPRRRSPWSARAPA